LYAVGLILAECLVGEPIVMGKDVVQILCQQASEREIPVPDPVKRTSLWPVIQKSIEKNPDDRYSSALEMLEALQAIGYLPDERVTPGTLAEELGETVAGKGVPTPAEIRLRSGHGNKGPSKRKQKTSLSLLMKRSSRRTQIGMLAIVCLVAAGLVWAVSDGGTAEDEVPAVEANGELDEQSPPEPPPEVAAVDPEPAEEVEPDVPEEPPVAVVDPRLAVGITIAGDRIGQALPDTHEMAFEGTDGASVWLGDNMLGEIPFTAKAPNIAHEIELSFRRPGYREQSQSVSLGETSVNVELRRRGTRDTSRREVSAPIEVDDPSAPPSGLFGGSEISGQ